MLPGPALSVPAQSLKVELRPGASDTVATRAPGVGTSPGSMRERVRAEEVRPEPKPSAVSNRRGGIMTPALSTRALHGSAVRHDPGGERPYGPDVREVEVSYVEDGVRSLTPDGRLRRRPSCGGTV